jgi:hypothetical protein
MHCSRLEDQAFFRQISGKTLFFPFFPSLRKMHF